MDNLLEQELIDADDARELSLGPPEDSAAAYPPQYGRPAELSQDGLKAWRVIMEVLVSEKAIDPGQNRQVFHSPSDWTARNEACAPESELIVAHDGGGHAPYFNLDYGAFMSRSTMDRALDEAGFYIETQTPMCSAVCRRPLNDHQLALLEQQLTHGEDDAEAEAAKETIQYPVPVEDSEKIFVDAGLSVTNHGNWKHMFTFDSLVPDRFSWATNHEMWEGPMRLGNRLTKATTKATGKATGFTTLFNQKQGRWIIRFWLDMRIDAVTEARLDRSYSPATKEHHIRQFFTHNGLHIDTMVEEPADPRLGALTEPLRFIKSALEPNTTKPWTTAGVAGPELTNFLRRIKSGLGQILGTADIDYRTRFDPTLSAWRVKWFIGPEPLQPQVAEGLDDEDADLVKEIEPAQFQAVAETAAQTATGLVLLHGTCTVHLPLIQQRGLEYPYLTNNPQVAKYYAESAADEDGGSPIIIRVQISNTNELRADFPSFEEPLSFVYKKYANDEKEWYKALSSGKSISWPKDDADWQTSLRVVGSVIYNGTIEPGNIQLTEHIEDGDDDRVAIVGVFRKKGDGYEVLVARREVDPEAGKWCIPGGHAQVGESIIDGAKREMKEETHLELDDLTFIKKMRNAERNADVYVYGTMMPEGDRAKPGDDAEKIKWVPIDDLPELAFDNNDLIAEIADKMELTEPALAEGFVAYHASPNKFNKFDTSKEGAHFGTAEQASNLRKTGLRKPRPYELAIKNPLRLHDIGVWNNFNNLHGVLSVGGHITDAQADAAWAAWQRSDDEGWEALKQALEQNGYDGIVYQNEQEGPGDSYVALRPEQITPIKEAAATRTVYHAAPGSRAEAIQREGLQPRIEKRGIHAADKVPAVYFFDGIDSAEDALVNWLADEWDEAETEAVVFSTDLPESELEPDPEIAGAYRVTRPIPPEQLKVIARWPLGESIVQESLAADDPFPYDKIEVAASLWFERNARKLHDERWELGFAFYLDPRGELRTTDLNRGEEAEIDIPEAPAGCDEVGSLHTHVGSIGEFSQFDMEEGQKMADKLGHPYYMFVIGPDDEGTGMIMSQELFEPGGVSESKKGGSILAQIKLAQPDSVSESIMARFERMIGEDKARNKFGKNGFLVVFEGIDGSGKTTQVTRLADWLNEKDYSYVTTKWASSKALHDALWKAKCKRRLTPMSFSLLHASDMHIRYENIVVPALKKGKVMICDRYYFTSYVRDKIRGIDEDLLDMVYKDFREPDLVFFLHVPVKTAVERLLSDRGVGYYSSGRDVGYKTKGIEKTTERYEQDMQDRYEKLFKDKPNVIRLDAARSIKEVAKDIKREMRERLGIK